MNPSLCWTPRPWFHETYLRIVRAGRLDISERPQFLAYSAHVMRSIVVDFVRQHRAASRGGDRERLELDPEIATSPPQPEDEIIRVSEALDDLGKVDERLVKVVEMRYFTGLSVQRSRLPWESTNAPSAASGKRPSCCWLSRCDSCRASLQLAR